MIKQCTAGYRTRASGVGDGDSTTEPPVLIYKGTGGLVTNLKRFKILRYLYIDIEPSQVTPIITVGLFCVSM